MKKVLTAILIVLLIVAGVLGGTYVYISNSKSPTAVAARTLAKLKTVESASVKMNVDTGVKAEVGILQYFGIKDPETTITMDYDIDMFKDPALLHTYVSIKAFDIEAIKNIETIFKILSILFHQDRRWRKEGITIGHDCPDIVLG